MKHSAMMLLSSLLLANSALAADLRPVEGTLSVEVEDYAQHAIEKFRLHDNQGVVHDLQFNQTPRWLKPGQSVRVFGKAYGKQLQVSDSNVSLLQSTETTSSAQTVSSTITPISGNHTLLVAEVNFAINPIVRLTETEIQDLLFNQSAAFYSENSYGAMSLSGDTTSPVTVDVDVSVCNTDAVAAAADSELSARGFNLDNYDHIMYLIPTHPKCTWSGKANVVGKRSWIKRVQLSTINHELGHNLGLYHANKKDCGDVTTADSSQCTVSEYGDYLSAMSGTSTPKHFNAFHKEQLGWLSGDRIETVTSDTRVTLSPVEAEGNFPLLAKIPNGKDAAGNALYYYIEYRQATGFDSSLATEAGSMLDGIRLREGADNNAASSYLLDPTPNSTAYDWDDISLSPGQVFEQQGVRVEVVSSDASSVTFDVSLQGATAQCSRANSSLTLQSAVSELQQGQQGTVDLLLTNNDSSICGDASYSFSVQTDAGLYATLANNTVTLAPQSSTHVSLSLEAVQGNGSNGWQVSASRQATSQQLQSSGYVTLTSVTSNTAPLAIDDSFNDISTNTVLNVLANDSDLDGDNLFISGTTQGQYGKVTVNADNTLTYAPQKRFKGSDSFSYTISDGQLTAIAIVTISPSSSGGATDTTTSSSGKGGGGKGKNR
ncbi:peptidase M11 [Shewanella mangrovi]|uniref:Peptidase M11 n=1 Tax=Shewanella mangrovi TaxID=1515746 RepID=A0A094LUF1_9GAMM|nr:Ig-like domain-containing protein [Shewanella mangrovi]KFZ38828.1 peptidase M11 [Shewanella mangrovi]